MTATDAPVRDLAGICEQARRVPCGLGDCQQRPGEDCASGGGVHLARVNRAWRYGLVSDGEYRAVLLAAEAFRLGTVIYPGMGGQA